MAAAQPMSRPVGLNGTRTNGILLDTMQLVAPRKSMPVPNHLLESKIYNKVAQNAIVKATPAVIHFGGFELGKVHRIPLSIGNVATEVIRMHIIPPQTKYFDIKYTKGERLVPGLTLDCYVEFVPDEWRYYYDCIRINCKGEENLVIPIHAYPVMDTTDFPSIINFPVTPIGHKKVRKIPLKCNAPIDFEFQMSFLQTHTSFAVEPMSGVIPANDEIEITVTFAPTEFATARMQLQLTISQFNSKPLVCTCVGNSAPGLAKQISEASVAKAVVEEVTDTSRVESPIDRARKKKKQKEIKKVPKTASSTTSVVSKSQEVEKDGIRFPNNLSNPWAVGQVLNQQAGKLRVKDLREAIEAAKESNAPSNRQMKEAVFDQAVRKDVYEERQNQLRWQVKVGDDPVSGKKKIDVLDARKESWKDYKFQRGDPIPDVEYSRTCTDCTFRRTVRDASSLAKEGIKFDTFVNNPWAVRQAALDKFAQAARTVLVRVRANIKIKGLKNMVLEWGKKKQNRAQSAEGENEQEEEEEEESSEFLDNHLKSEKIKHYKFPYYTPPDVKDDMAPDALDVVPVEQTDVVVQKKVPYYNLKVPQQYKLCGYVAHNVQGSSSGYVPPKLVRTLRTGAEDEVISLPIPSEMKLERAPAELTTEDTMGDLINEGDMRVEEVMSEESEPTPQPEELAPPDALFKPIDYPPLHIFNPAPGLQVFQSPLPYTEVDPDFHLCPIPRYTRQDETNNPHITTQKKYLDREDTIKNVMTWKKFPSQGLTSLANTPTLTNVWVPRWTNPFSEDLVPTEVPQLFDGLSQEDKDHIMDDGDEGDDEHTKAPPIALTPDMVNAQFPLIDASQVNEDEKKSSDMFPHGHKMPPTNIPVSVTGPVPREKREQELDYFLNKKYNKLGTKIQGRIDHMKHVTSNETLLLK